jgi:hypothetical protein
MKNFKRGVGINQDLRLQLDELKDTQSKIQEYLGSGLQFG